MSRKSIIPCVKKRLAQGYDRDEAELYCRNIQSPSVPVLPKFVRADSPTAENIASSPGPGWLSRGSSLGSDAVVKSDPVATATAWANNLGRKVTAKDKQGWVDAAKGLGVMDPEDIDAGWSHVMKHENRALATLKGIFEGLKSEHVVDEVKAQLRDDFPPSSMKWIDQVDWQGPENIPLEQIDYSNVSTWAASKEPGKVKHFAHLIANGWSKPIILVKTPGGAKYRVIDGHHRALAYRMEQKPAAAFVAHVPKDEGPWDIMHSAQKNDTPSVMEMPRPSLSPAVKEEKTSITDLKAVFESVAWSGYWVPLKQMIDPNKRQVEPEPEEDPADINQPKVTEKRRRKKVMERMSVNIKTTQAPQVGNARGQAQDAAEDPGGGYGFHSWSANRVYDMALRLIPLYPLAKPEEILAMAIKKSGVIPTELTPEDDQLLKIAVEYAQNGPPKTNVRTGGTPGGPFRSQSDGHYMGIRGTMGMP